MFAPPPPPIAVFLQLPLLIHKVTKAAGQTRDERSGLLPERNHLSNCGKPHSLTVYTSHTHTEPPHTLSSQPHNLHSPHTHTLLTATQLTLPTHTHTPHSHTTYTPHTHTHSSQPHNLHSPHTLLTATQLTLPTHTLRTASQLTLPTHTPHSHTTYTPSTHPHTPHSNNDHWTFSQSATHATWTLPHEPGWCSLQRGSTQGKVPPHTYVRGSWNT